MGVRGGGEVGSFALSPIRCTIAREEGDLVGAGMCTLKTVNPTRSRQGISEIFGRDRIALVERLDLGNSLRDRDRDRPKHERPEAPRGQDLGLELSPCRDARKDKAQPAAGLPSREKLGAVDVIEDAFQVEAPGLESDVPTTTSVSGVTSCEMTIEPPLTVY